MMVADKLNELLQPPSATGIKLPRALTDATASTRILEALHHFHKAPAFATESQTPVRIVMGKMVQLAFEVSPSIVYLKAIPQQNTAIIYLIKLPN